MGRFEFRRMRLEVGFCRPSESESCRWFGDCRCRCRCHSRYHYRSSWVESLWSYLYWWEGRWLVMVPQGFILPIYHLGTRWGSTDNEYLGRTFYPLNRARAGPASCRVASWPRASGCVSEWMMHIRGDACWHMRDQRVSDDSCLLAPWSIRSIG